MKFLKPFANSLGPSVLGHARKRFQLHYKPVKGSRSSSTSIRVGKDGSLSFSAKSSSSYRNVSTLNTDYKTNQNMLQSQRKDPTEAGGSDYHKLKQLDFSLEDPREKDIELDHTWLNENSGDPEPPDSANETHSTAIDQSTSPRRSQRKSQTWQKNKNRKKSQNIDSSQNKPSSENSASSKRAEILSNPREQWQIQKKALTKKFGVFGWQPRKRLSPDALDGIRSLHAHDPEKHSTSALADQFKVSPEAIRRILKSKWRPNEDEEEDRRLRWEKRGQQIWSQMSELGIKPPKKWRAVGAHGSISYQWSGQNGASVNTNTNSEYIPLADRIY